MNIKKFVKSGLMAILASSLALSSPSLPRGYKNARLGSTLNEIQILYPDGEILKYYGMCKEEEVGIGKNHIAYLTYGDIDGLSVYFCFPKTTESKLSKIVLEYKLYRSDILNLIKESKKKYGEPVEEKFGEEGYGYCNEPGEPQLKDQFFDMFWVDDQTRLRIWGWLRNGAPINSNCYNSDLYLDIIDRISSGYNKTDTLP